VGRLTRFLKSARAGTWQGTRALRCLTVKLLPDRGRRGGRRRVRQQELGVRLGARG
jgi:hypothetical protein